MQVRHKAKHKLLRVIAISLGLGLVFSVSSCSPTKDEPSGDPTLEATPSTKSAATIAVWPRSANALPAMSLGAFIVKAIPVGNQISWDHLHTGDVLWLTEGIDYSGENTTDRRGIARIHAHGKMSRILRQQWEELGWSVELSTDSNPGFGPTSITIRPGFTDDTSPENEYICFGTGFDGCSFDVGALSDPSLQLSKSCEIGEGASNSLVFAARTTDGRTGTVVYSGSGGSGGWSNSVEISTLTPQEYCTTFKDRGY